MLAVDDVEKSLLIAETLRKHFPHLKIYARARNRFHAYRLMDFGVDFIIRETLLSSLELAREVLKALGTPAWQAKEIVERFRLYDERLLQAQHAVYHDETQLRQASRDALQELDGLLRGDREEVGTDAARQAVFSPSDIQMRREAHKGTRREARGSRRELRPWVRRQPAVVARQAI